MHHAVLICAVQIKTKAVGHLGSSIGRIEIVEGNVLHNLLLFEHITFWERHKFISFQIDVRSKNIAATHTLWDRVRSPCK